MKKGRSAGVYLRVTELFILAAFISLSFYLISGYSLFSLNDGFKQHYPKIIALRQAVADLFRNRDISFWTWNLGYGEDAVSTLYTIWLDPFNYVAAAFPSKYIEIGHWVASVLRLYAAGISMLFFLKKSEYTDNVCITGGLCYCLSCFAMRNITGITFIMMPMILFPLIMAGVLDWEKNRKPALLVISAAAAVANAVYIAYMSAIAVIIYILIQWFFSKGNRRISGFIRYIAEYAGLALTAVLISLPVSLFVIRGLAGTGSGGSSEVPLLPALKEVFLGLAGYVSNTAPDRAGIHMVFAGSVLLLMVPVVIYKLISKKAAACHVVFLVLTAAQFFPPFNSLMNGLGYPAGRWIYIYVFFYAWCGAEALDTFEETAKEGGRKIALGWTVIFIAMAAVMAAGSIACGFFTMPNIAVSIVSAAFYIVFAALLLSKADRTRKTRIIAYLTAANLGIVNLLCFNSFSDTFANPLFDKAGTIGSYYSGSVLKNAAAIDDGDFYRIDRVERIDAETGESRVNFDYDPPDDALYYGEKTADAYYTVMNPARRAFDEALCISGNLVKRTSLLGNDSRSRINFITGMKYFIYSDEKAEKHIPFGYEPYLETEDASILKTKFDTGLGFVYPSVIKESDFYDSSYTDRQQILMQAACVDDDYAGNVTVTGQESLVLSSEKAEYHFEDAKDVEFGDGTIKVSREYGSVTLVTEEPAGDGEFYICFRNLKKKTDMPDVPYGDFKILIKTGNTGKDINYRGGKGNQDIIGVTDFLVNMGPQPGESRTVLKFRMAGEYTYDGIDLITLPYEGLEEQMETLASDRFMVTTEDGDHIVGYTDGSGGFLYLGIPYKSGWNIFIDGEKKTLYRANIGFMGTDIDAGHHEIELVYKPRGMYASLVLCAAGWLIFIFILKNTVCNRKRSLL